MFFKKMTMIIMMAGFASGIVLSSASVDAKENTTAAVSVQAAADPVSEDQATKEDIVQEEDQNTENPVKEGESTENAAVGKRSAASTPAPTVAAAQVIKITKDIPPASGKTTTSAKKKAKAQKKYSASELRLMASIINCEAGGESFQGQVAVGIVVMNRVKSDLFPNSIKKVIYQKGQFTPVRNGILRKKLKQYDAGKIHSAQWKSCIKAAKQALNGKTVIKLKGKTKSMKGVRFFSVYLKGAKFRLGGHRFR